MRLECGTDNWPGPCSVFLQLGNLTRLKTLCLHSIKGPRGSLWNLCQVIPQLRVLSRLSLSNWNMDRESVDRENVDVRHVQAPLEATGPSPTLQIVSILHMSAWFTSESEALAWLLKSSRGYLAQMRLQSSADDICRASDQPDKTGTIPVLTAANSKPQITQLSISHTTASDDIKYIVGLFPTVQTTCMMLSWRVLPCFSLPHSVQILEVHFETFLHNDLKTQLLGCMRRPQH